MNKKQKGLWAILAPVKTTILLGMGINALSVVLKTASLVLLSYALVALYEQKELTVFGVDLSLTNTILSLA
ncbi:MAG: ABC transporter ATP-binding protein/permease, partial [Deltaproteobacteria bacterium]